MALMADSKYNGRVAQGSALITTRNGNLGYQVMLDYDSDNGGGQTSFTIWLTPKNKDRAEKTFETLGISPDQLKDPTYVEYQLGTDIVGREVSFGTREEEYQGKRSVKVSWIGRKSEGKLSDQMSLFFGGKPVPVSKPIDDNDIPF